MAISFNELIESGILQEYPGANVDGSDNKWKIISADGKECLALDTISNSNGSNTVKIDYYYYSNPQASHYTYCTGYSGLYDPAKPDVNLAAAFNKLKQQIKREMNQQSG